MLFWSLYVLHGLLSWLCAVVALLVARYACELAGVSGFWLGFVESVAFWGVYVGNRWMVWARWWR